MGKRSAFLRRDRDFYSTWDVRAVKPLLKHLPANSTFYELMAGAGDLVDHLENEGHLCIYACDIHPLRSDIVKFDAMNFHGSEADFIITNTPWPAKGQGGNPTIDYILHFSELAPTWMLLSADFKHNAYFSKVESRCRKIVSIGRVQWIKGSSDDAKDNCAWYLFDKPTAQPAQFYGRAA